MDNFRIRKLESSDGKDIGDIYKSIVRKPADIDFITLIQKHAEFENYYCFVAELDDRVIGFIISYVLTLGFGIEKSAWIPALGVYPEFMGQGVGHLLAQEVFKIYKSLGISRVYTSVRWDSTDMLSFYKTLGFERSEFINLKKYL